MASDLKHCESTFFSEDAELALRGDEQALLRLFSPQSALSKPLAQVSNHPSQDFQDAAGVTSASLPTIPQRPLHEAVAIDDPLWRHEALLPPESLLSPNPLRPASPDSSLFTTLSNPPCGAIAPDETLLQNEALSLIRHLPQEALSLLRPTPPLSSLLANTISSDNSQSTAGVIQSLILNAICYQT